MKLSIKHAHIEEHFFLEFKSSHSDVILILFLPLCAGAHRASNPITKDAAIKLERHAHDVQPARLCEMRQHTAIDGVRAGLPVTVVVWLFVASGSPLGCDYYRRGGCRHRVCFKLQFPVEAVLMFVSTDEIW